MAPGLVIFDCDGVLVDTERLQVVVEARVLTELGWPMAEDEVVARWMGRTSAAQLADIAGVLGDAAALSYDELSTAEVHEAFERHLHAVVGVPDLLDHLDRAGVPTCVASSGSFDRMRRTLGLTGLHDRFAGRISSGTEVEHGKPAPDLFLLAAGRMRVPPAKCVVVEDSVFGVRAAVAAGMRVLGYAGGLTSAAALEAAGAESVDQMAEIPALLGLS